MKHTAVGRAQYTHDGRINCWVKFDGFQNPVPFTADKDDIEEHSRIIYTELKAGKYGKIAPYEQ